MNYYINPKTQELIIVDLETNEISVAQKLEPKTESTEVPVLSEKKKAEIKQSIIGPEIEKPKKKKPAFNSEEHRNQRMKEMLEQEIPVKQIAKGLGVHIATVYNYAKKNKTSTKSSRLKPTPEQIEEMREMRKQGMSYGKIGKAFGFSKDTADYHTRDIKKPAKKEVQKETKEERPESTPVEISKTAKDKKEKFGKKKYFCLLCQKSFESWLDMEQAVCDCGSHNVTEGKL